MNMLRRTKVALVVTGALVAAGLGLTASPALAAGGGAGRAGDCVGTSCGVGYVDANGDGTCDNRQDGTCAPATLCDGACAGVGRGTCDGAGHGAAGHHGCAGRQGRC